VYSRRHGSQQHTLSAAAVAAADRGTAWSWREIRGVDHDRTDVIWNETTDLSTSHTSMVDHGARRINGTVFYRTSNAIIASVYTDTQILCY